jgi:hypothetical protein
MDPLTYTFGDHLIRVDDDTIERFSRIVVGSFRAPLAWAAVALVPSKKGDQLSVRVGNTSSPGGAVLRPERDFPGGVQLRCARDRGAGVAGFLRRGSPPWWPFELVVGLAVRVDRRWHAPDPTSRAWRPGHRASDRDPA